MKQNQEIRKLKIFVINQSIRRKREQEEFFKELKKESSINDILTIKEVVEQYKISSKTFHRWKNKGLQFNQRGYKGKITIKRSDLENYIKKERYGRLL